MLRIGALLQKESINTLIRAMVGRRAGYLSAYQHRVGQAQAYQRAHAQMTNAKQQSDGQYARNIREAARQNASLHAQLQQLSRSKGDHHKEIARLQAELRRVTTESAGLANEDIEMDGGGDTISFDQNHGTKYAEFQSSFTGPWQPPEFDSDDEDELAFDNRDNEAVEHETPGGSSTMMPKRPMTGAHVNARAQETKLDGLWMYTRPSRAATQSISARLCSKSTVHASGGQSRR